MAGLLLAGALSGAGEGLSKGLEKTQALYGWQQLESIRQQMEESRLDKQLKATSTLQAERLKAEAEQGRLTREQALELEKIRGTTTKEEGAAERVSRESIAASTQKTNLEIAQINKKAITATHEADKALKEWELEQSKQAAGLRNKVLTAVQSGDQKAIKAAKDAYTAYAEKPWESDKIDLTSAVNGMKETGTEITRLSIALKDPMIDRKGPDYAAMTQQLDRATAAHAAFTARVQELSGSTPAGFEAGSRGQISSELWNKFVNQNPGKPLSTLKAAAEKMGFIVPESFVTSTRPAQGVPGGQGLIQGGPPPGTLPGPFSRPPLGLPPGMERR